MREAAHTDGFRLLKRPSLRRQQHDRVRSSASIANLLDRPRQRLGLQHHPRAAAVGHIVHAAVTIDRMVAQIVHRDINQPPGDAAADDALRQACDHHPREDRDDVELHKSDLRSSELTDVRIRFPTAVGPSFVNS